MPDPRNKPILITVSGLSGSGKSTAARALAAALPGTVHIDSDETRKELFGIPPTQKLPPEGYTPEATQRLIVETARRIKAHLAEGRNVAQSVMLDSDIARDRQEEIAAEAGADFQGVWLKTDSKTLIDRVIARRGDASDASPEYAAQQQGWNVGTIKWPIIDSSQPREDVLKQVLALLALRER